MKKLKYYSAYIPVIGWFTTMFSTLVGEDSCIYDSGLHFVVTAFIQGVSFVSILVLLALL